MFKLNENGLSLDRNIQGDELKYVGSLLLLKSDILNPIHPMYTDDGVLCYKNGKFGFARVTVTFPEKSFLGSLKFISNNNINLEIPKKSDSSIYKEVDSFFDSVCENMDGTIRNAIFSHDLLTALSLKLKVEFDKRMMKLVNGEEELMFDVTTTNINTISHKQSKSDKRVGYDRDSSNKPSLVEKAFKQLDEHFENYKEEFSKWEKSFSDYVIPDMDNKYMVLRSTDGKTGLFTCSAYNSALFDFVQYANTKEEINSIKESINQK